MSKKKRTNEVRSESEVSLKPSGKIQNNCLSLLIHIGPNIHYCDMLKRYDLAVNFVSSRNTFNFGARTVPLLNFQYFQIVSPSHSGRKDNSKQSYCYFLFMPQVFSGERAFGNCFVFKGLPSCLKERKENEMK